MFLYTCALDQGFVMLRSVAVSVVALVLVAGCGPRESAVESGDTWVGNITTEGNVTTVVNESGSVWGGTATLVEEASIGVDAGDDPYMLGQVRSIAASDDRIYLVDLQVPALRVYDWSGTWLRDIGREGQGPGEFQYPTGVGVDDLGRVWVHEQAATRLVVFSLEGEALTTRNLGGTRISGSTSSMTLTPDGHAYVFDVVRPDDPTSPDERRIVMRPHDIEGNAGEAIEIPQFDPASFLEARTTNAVRFTNVPFHPAGVTDFTAARAVLSGYPEDYRFEIQHADGARTIVERGWQPVAVLPEEAAAHRRAVTAYMRDMDHDWSWSGPEIPDTKAAYSDFLPAVSGEIWVVRPGAGTLVADCDEASFDPGSDAPCWEEERIIDVFGADGRYLGQVDVPDEVSMQPLPFIRGGDIIARVEDDAGTVMVKRYRLVLPGER